MALPVLSYSNFKGGLIARLMGGGAVFKDRSVYVGASEVGGCPRLVAFRKALKMPWTPDADSAGVMLPGRLAEDEVIAILQTLGFDETRLLFTGKNQREMDGGNLHAHPDGQFAASSFTLDPSTAYFKADGSTWKNSDLQALLVGEGILEVKSGSSGVFRETIKRGLSGQYQDQTQSNMGLAGFGWTLLIFVCRDNFSKVAFIVIPFDEHRFRDRQRQADAILGSAALARTALLEAGLQVEPPADEELLASYVPLDPEDSGVHGLVAEHLLPPDSERGYCQKCPLWHSCPAMVRVRDEKEFPEDVMEEVAALAAMRAEGSDMEKAGKEDSESARDRLVELAAQYGANRATLSGDYKAVIINYQKGRETCNLEKLRTEFPEAATACLSRGEDFAVVKVTRAKR